MSDWNNNSRFPDIHIPWWVIIVAFSLMPPLGVFLLLYKLFRDEQPTRRQQEWQRKQKEWFDTIEQGVQTTASQVEQSFREYQQKNPSPAVKRQQKRSKAKDKDTDRVPIKGGKGFVVVGLIMAAIFGIGTVDEMLTWLPDYPWYAFREAFAPMLFTCGALACAVWGHFKTRQAQRFRKLLNLIGNQEVVDIHAIADAFPCSYERACNMLQNMTYNGHLGKLAYVDSAAGQLILNGQGVTKRKAPEQKAPPKPTPEKEMDQERTILRQIQQVNDAIPDPLLSRKISRIEEITGHILEYQKKHPEKAGELHTFLNYYLPTTLKILNSYAELDRQGVDGENISATKERIEQMMDMVVEGFEKQLDQLFRDEMLDIASDISVMEKMMGRDGLTGDELKMPKADAADAQPAAPAGIQLTLNPDEPAQQTAAAATGTEWESGFYRKTKNELEQQLGE